MTGTGTWRYVVLLSALAAALLWVAEPHADEIRAAQPPHSNVLSTPEALLSALEGRAYYLLADNVTCRANTPDHPYLKSWKNKLTFTQGKVVIWQTLCNDSPLVLDFDGRAFVFTPDLSSLTYAGESYTYYAHPPQLCDQGQWCPVEAPQGPKTQDGDESQSPDTPGARQAQ